MIYKRIMETRTACFFPRQGRRAGQIRGTGQEAGGQCPCPFGRHLILPSSAQRRERRESPCSRLLARHSGPEKGVSPHPQLCDKGSPWERMQHASCRRAHLTRGHIGSKASQPLFQVEQMLTQCRPTALGTAAGSLTPRGPPASRPPRAPTHTLAPRGGAVHGWGASFRFGVLFWWQVPKLLFQKKEITRVRKENSPGRELRHCEGRKGKTLFTWNFLEVLESFYQ